MTVALQFNLKSRILILPAPFFFLKTVLTTGGLLCFHMNFEFFWDKVVSQSYSSTILGLLSGLTFRSLIHFEFISVCGVRKCSSFTLLHVLASFPSTTCKRDCLFSILYFVLLFKDKMSTGAWIYLWAFYFVSLIYISVFVPVPYCLDYCSFVV